MSETKTEWPTLDAVPADVRTVWDQLGDEYRRKGDTWEFRFPGIEWTEMALWHEDGIRDAIDWAGAARDLERDGWSKPRTVNSAQAPFVAAAEEG